MSEVEWPPHWSTDDMLSDLHARYHDQPGNLIPAGACGWEGCEFWDAAELALTAGRSSRDVEVAELERELAQYKDYVEGVHRELDGYTKQAEAAGFTGSGAGYQMAISQALFYAARELRPLHERLASAEAVIERVRSNAKEWADSPTGEVAPTRAVGAEFLALLPSASLVL